MSASSVRSWWTSTRPDLAEEGLAGALDELAHRLERNGIRVDLRVDEAAAGIPQATAGVLFRSAQEILRNVASHSSAQHVELTVTVESSQATMVVDDDGRGFDEDGLAKRVAEGHVGLRGLSDLVTDAGGSLTVRSAPGQGTRTDISVPIRSGGMKK